MANTFTADADGKVVFGNKYIQNGTLTMTDGNGGGAATIEGFKDIQFASLTPVTSNTSTGGASFSSNTITLQSAVSGSVFKVFAFGN